jgi:outer membrane lipoprotein LolB
MTPARFSCAAAIAFFLAACAAPQFRESADNVVFELAGRIAVKYRDEAASGNVAWRHSADADEMLITSPLGGGIGRIVRTKDLVTLTTSEGHDVSARDAETLTEQVLGFRIPLAGLADWVRGHAGPGEAVTRKDAEGRLAELEQSGWKIEYLGWEGTLPSRMRLSYPGVELRLAIYEWK